MTTKPKPKHKNHEVLTAIADSKDVEYRRLGEWDWTTLGEPDRFTPSPATDIELVCWRIKPVPPKVLEHGLPGPITETPRQGDKYYTVQFGSPCLTSEDTWEGHSYDRTLLKHRLIWATKQDAEKAARIFIQLMGGTYD